jgi:hypothetical protein
VHLTSTETIGTPAPLESSLFYNGNNSGPNFYFIFVLLWGRFYKTMLNLKKNCHLLTMIFTRRLIFQSYESLFLDQFYLQQNYTSIKNYDSIIR